MTTAPSIEEEPNLNGEIGIKTETGIETETGPGNGIELGIVDGGILKALKDLEWEVSEILTEKVKKNFNSKFSLDIIEAFDSTECLVNLNRYQVASKSI